MTRFDPSANANALLGGIHTGIALAEEQRRAQQDELLNHLRMQEDARHAQAFRMQQTTFDQGQQQLAGAQRFYTDEFRKTEPQANGTEEDFFQPSSAEFGQQVSQFSQLHPAMQQHILGPQLQHAQLLQQSQMVERELREKFPRSPEIVQAAMEDFWLRKGAGMDDRTVMELQNGRMPIPDRGAFLARARTANVPETEADDLWRRAAGLPILSPLQRFKQQQDAADAEILSFISSGQAGPVDMSRASPALLRLLNTQDFQRGMQDDRQASAEELAGGRNTEWDRRNEVTNNQATVRLNTREARIDARNMAREHKPPNIDNDPEYKRLNKAVQSWTREFNNQRDINDTDARTAALGSLHDAEDRLDAYMADFAKTHPAAAPAAVMPGPAAPMAPAAPVPAPAMAPAAPVPAPAPAAAQIPGPAGPVSSVPGATPDDVAATQAALKRAAQELGPGADKAAIFARARQILGK